MNDDNGKYLSHAERTVRAAEKQAAAIEKIGEFFCDDFGAYLLVICDQLEKLLMQKLDHQSDVSWAITQRELRSARGKRLEAYFELASEQVEKLKLKKPQTVEITALSAAQGRVISAIVNNTFAKIVPIADSGLFTWEGCPVVDGSPEIRFSLATVRSLEEIGLLKRCNIYGRSETQDARELDRDRFKPVAEKLGFKNLEF